MIKRLGVTLDFLHPSLWTDSFKLYYHLTYYKIRCVFVVYWMCIVDSNPVIHNSIYYIGSLTPIAVLFCSTGFA
jgi:hypothetical protein